MRIAHLIDAQGGGALTHVLTLARNLQEKPREGVTIEVIFFIPGPVYRLAKELGIPAAVIRKRFPLDFTLVWRLSRYLTRQKVQILHTHTINSNFYGRWAARLSGVPVVTTMHSYMIDELKGLKSDDRLSRLFFRVDWRMALWSRRFIAVSSGIRKRLLDQGVPNERIDVIPHGVPLPSPQEPLDSRFFRESLGIPVSAPVVAIVGRLVPVKNHHIFLEAARKVVAGKPEVRFLIVGDGMLRGDLERLAARLGISGNVVFTGWRNDMGAVYDAIDLLVLCSSTESQGLVLVEAMAHRKAVIATDVDEIGRTVIPEKTGLLIPPEDAAGLVREVERLLADSGLRARLGETGRKFVEENFSVDRMTDRILDSYRGVLRSKVERGVFQTEGGKGG